MNLYILMRICNKHYSFPSTVSLTAGLMCFIHFRMSINVQVMKQIKQAGAELCQAQDKFSLNGLDFIGKC